MALSGVCEGASGKSLNMLCGRIAPKGSVTEDTYSSQAACACMH